MQITIDVPNGSTAKVIAAELRFAANRLDGIEGKEASAKENTTAPTTAKAPAKEAKKDTKKDANDDLFDLDANTEGAEGDEFSLDDTPPEKEEEPAIKFSDVNKALRDHAKKNGREEAIKIVKKFAKTGAAADIKESDYPKLMKLLGGTK